MIFCETSLVKVNIGIAIYSELLLKSCLDFVVFVLELLFSLVGNVSC